MKNIARWLATLSFGMLSASVTAGPIAQKLELVPKATAATDRLVFSHFMIGIVSNRQGPADFDDDMKRAKALGIDAFALNIGVDPYTDTQLGFAYQSAANNNMKVFLSFDFNWWNTGQASAVGAKIKQYASLPAQLMVDNKVFVSSFAGDSLDLGLLRSSAGVDLFFAPNFHPGQSNFGTINGALNWMAWDNNGNNKAPTPGHNVTVAEGDTAYITALNGEPYVAPASAWFSTHFGGEVSYSKNWVFPSDLLWFNRWQNLLTLGSRFVELVTWNDYGESHYIAPLSSPHTDDGASKWVMDMPHNGWLDMAAPFIAAYKAGDSSVEKHITQDQLIYWYRPTPKSIDCDSTDTTMQGNPNNSSGNFFRGRPNGYETLADEVFIVSLFTSPATIQANSGGISQKFNAPAGASAFSLPMGLGQQSFSVTRNGQVILNGISMKDIVNTCICGIYNFNAYVGTLPAPTTIDQLQPAGLARLSDGLLTACPTNTLHSITVTLTYSTTTSGSTSTSASGTGCPTAATCSPAITTVTVTATSTVSQPVTQSTTTTGAATSTSSHSSSSTTAPVTTSSASAPADTSPTACSH